MPIIETETAVAVTEAAFVEDEAKIRLILTWIYFNWSLLQAYIAEESFNDYIDIEKMKETDVTEISDCFQKRTSSQRIIF